MLLSQLNFKAVGYTVERGGEEMEMRTGVDFTKSYV